MREMVFSTFVLVVSILLSCLCIGFYFPTKDKYLQLTYSKPFSDWGAVRDAFYNLEGKNYTSAQSLTNTAWCNRPAFRPGTVPENRSESCRCLTKKVRRLLNETNNTLSFSRDVVRGYGSEAVGCFAYRGVWDIWPCEGGCKVHPLIIAFTSNFIYVLLALGFQLGMHFNQSYGVALSNFLVAILGSAMLISFDSMSNGLYSIPFLWIALAFQFAVKEEIQPYTGAVSPAVPVFTPPSPFMVCFWLGFAFTTPVLTVHLSSAQLVRDVVGVIAYGWVGYFAGLMGQRMFWVKWYVTERFPISHDVGGDFVVRKTFGNLMWYSLAAGQVGIWIGIVVLGSTQWYGDSPYAGSYVSFLLLILQLCIPLLEIFNGTRVAVQFEMIEMIQILLMLSINCILTIVGIIDTMR